MALAEPACGWINPTEEVSSSCGDDMTLVHAAGGDVAAECAECDEQGEVPLVASTAPSGSARLTRNRSPSALLPCRRSSRW